MSVPYSHVQYESSSCTVCVEQDCFAYLWHEKSITGSDYVLTNGNSPLH